MSTMFKNFLAKVFESTPLFDRRKIDYLFQNEIVIKDKLHDIYLAKYNKFWGHWARNYNIPKKHVADFFQRYGANLLKEYLIHNFPFNEQRMHLNVKQGGTSFDIVIIFIYRFARPELDAMKDIALKNLAELSISLIATRIFAEALLTFNGIISESAGYKYAMMVDEVKFLQKKDQGGQMVYMELCARPHD